ncbi:hypothetical protein H7827_20315 [Streptomyces sp. JH002]|uniref:hypothetical protein n=1 Tax=Streptomyces sp. JH002 TaxID=2763259 RepID=UPI003D803247
MTAAGGNDRTRVTVTLDLPVEQVRDWDRIDIGGRTEKVESVTALHNGRRLHFLRGGRLTLSTGRVLTITRTVLAAEHAEHPEVITHESGPA